MRSFRGGIFDDEIPPGRVWATLTDPAALSEALGAPARVEPEVGGAVVLPGARGVVTQVVAGERLALVLRLDPSVLGASGDREDTVGIAISAEGGGYDLEVEHRGVVGVSPFEVGRYWQDQVLGPLRAALRAPPEPASLPPEGPPTGEDFRRLLVLLSDPVEEARPTSRRTRATQGESSTNHEDTLSLRRPRPPGQAAHGPARRGLTTWTSELVALGRPVRVRVARAAAVAALPAWQRAAPSPRLDAVRAGFGPEGGGPPEAQIAALDAWLDNPSRARHRAALATTDRTRQLLFTSAEMGDLSELRWAYAYESATCAIGSVIAEGEAELAVWCAVEALGDGGSESDAAATVTRAIRGELSRWLEG